ncbi:hypothetical protein DIPPA_21111 [Diplonema papillatum]|nr:hypothetical protein DIPPA_21113 [Diplonema papillatum]KAJ9449124.1 hypothetical protein DIPPA_21111 [Diplonema papillatum]
MRTSMFVAVAALFGTASAVNSTALNELLDGVTINIPDTPFEPANMIASAMVMSELSADDLTGEVTSVQDTWGTVDVSIGSVGATVNLIALMGGVVPYPMKVKMQFTGVGVTANFSNSDGLGDTNQVNVSGITLTLASHTCLDGIICEGLMVVLKDYLASDIFTTSMEALVSESVTPFLQNLTAGVYADPAVVAAVDEALMVTEFGSANLVKLAGSSIATGLLNIMNVIYAAPRESGANSELGMMMRTLWPTLTIDVDVTLPVIAGGDDISTFSRMSVGIGSVVISDYSVPSVSLEVVGDYTLVMSVTMTNVAGRLTGTLLVEDKPNGNPDYTAPMVCDLKESSFRLNVSVMLGMDAATCGTLPWLSDSVSIPSEVNLTDPAYIVAAVKQLMEANEDVAEIVEAWQTHPLKTIKLSTMSVELLAGKIESFTTDGEFNQVAIAAADVANAFFFDSMNAALIQPITALQGNVTALLKTFPWSVDNHPCTA